MNRNQLNKCSSRTNIAFGLHGDFRIKKKKIDSRNSGAGGRVLSNIIYMPIVLTIIIEIVCKFFTFP